MDMIRDAATGATPPIAPRPATAAASRAETAAREFEAVFIAEMLEPLFASVETPGIAGGGRSEAFFKGLLQESYAKAVAARGGFGLGDAVKAALLEIQARAGAAQPEMRP